MDGGRGCFTGRFAGGDKDKTIINRTMLRFRPIAPKPATDGSNSSISLPKNNSELVTKGKAKRKYVKVNKNSRCKRNKVKRGKDGFDRTVVTLQLLPQIAIRKDSMVKESCCNLDFRMIEQFQKLPMLNTNNTGPENSTTIDFNVSDQSDLTAVMPPTRVVGWLLTVEHVTDTCMDGRGLGATDVKRIESLEADTCPGFVSDGGNKIQWINLAYRRMLWAAEEAGGLPPETAVRLVVKVELPIGYPAFACLVRVQSQYYKGMKEKEYSQTVPCDVWRMDFGGFAWKLDFEAALNLGLGR